MKNIIRRLDGANMDIDLVSPEDQIDWKQDPRPWNVAEDTSDHKCAMKNISICPYFCGIEYLDYVLCCYPHEILLVTRSSLRDPFIRSQLSLVLHNK